MKKTLTALSLALAAGVACAQATPVGLWKTIDDETKTERSLVRLSDNGGVVTGRIEKLLAADAKPDAKCEKCEDDRKDKPLVGLEIVRGAKKNDAGDAWEGGTILDPNKGKTYKLRLSPKEGGKQLEVRGYMGPFYRNQTWIRVE
jgi:uncharacterized protein (DUF2147 family)